MSRILVIEDDDGDALLVEELLRDARRAASICGARSLAEALARSAGGPTAPCSTSGLPDAAGLDRARASCGRRPPTSPWWCSPGSPTGHAGMAAVAAGAQDYLVKGEVDGAGLAQALRYAMERRRADAAARQLAAGRAAPGRERPPGPGPPAAADPRRRPRWSVATRYRPGGRRPLLGGDFFDAVEPATAPCGPSSATCAGTGPTRPPSAWPCASPGGRWCWPGCAAADVLARHRRRLRRRARRDARLRHRVRRSSISRRPAAVASACTATRRRCCRTGRWRWLESARAAAAARAARRPRRAGRARSPLPTSGRCCCHRRPLRGPGRRTGAARRGRAAGGRRRLGRPTSPGDSLDGCSTTSPSGHGGALATTWRAVCGRRQRRRDADRAVGDRRCAGGSAGSSCRPRRRRRRPRRGVLAFARPARRPLPLRRPARPGHVDAERLLAALVDQETGVRGFVLTGDRSFLEPYDDRARAEQDARGRADCGRRSPGDRGVELRRQVEAAERLAAGVRRATIAAATRRRARRRSAARARARAGRVRRGPRAVDDLEAGPRPPRDAEAREDLDRGPRVLRRHAAVASSR